MERTFVLGDIHGAWRALRQVIEKSGFKYDADRLIFLGDVADGWPETRQCIDELLKVKNLVYVLGNHDWWTLDWMQTGVSDEIWLAQGGQATVKSYGTSVPKSHVDLLNMAHTYFVDENRLFVHAGFNRNIPIEDQSLHNLLWDREFALTALNHYEKEATKLTTYNEVYIGHTPISYPQPIQCAEVWLMDTGAGWSGVLAMMNIDTKEIFTSDPVPMLYPGFEGRKKVNR